MCQMLCNIHLTRPNQIKSNQICLRAKTFSMIRFILPSIGTVSDVLGTVSDTISINIEKLSNTFNPMFILEPSGGSRNMVGTKMAIMEDGRIMLMR